MIPTTASEAAPAQRQPGAAVSGFEPIFVVGVSRSGTTLLASMLNAHRRISCGPETFFFPRLARVELPKVLSDPRWPRRATRFITSMRLGGSDVRIHDLFERSAEQIDADLRAQPPSVTAMLGALTGARAAQEGKPRWAEKTPNHLLYLHDIRRYYPRAPVVRIVRDPRDVALSLTKVPFGSSSKLANLYLWLERDERSWRFFDEDAYSLTIRFEDLVSNPRAVLTRVCEHAGETFDEAMLTARTGSGLASSIEWWKERAGQPVDRRRAERWRRHYSAEEAVAAGVICHAGLRRYGYPLDGQEPATIPFHPLTRAFVERHENLIVELGARGIRLEPWLWRRDGLEQASGPAVFWGGSSELTWHLGSSNRRRLTNMIEVARYMGRTVLRGERPTWIDEPLDIPSNAGIVERFCTLTLRMVARRQSSREFVTGTVRS